MNWATKALLISGCITKLYLGDSALLLTGEMEESDWLSSIGGVSGGDTCTNPLVPSMKSSTRSLLPPAGCNWRKNKALQFHWDNDVRNFYCTFTLFGRAVFDGRSKQWPQGSPNRSFIEKIGKRNQLKGTVSKLCHILCLMDSWATWSDEGGCMESFQRMVRIWGLVILLQISTSLRENACCWQSSSRLITMSRSLVSSRWTLTSESVMSIKSASTTAQSLELGRDVRNLLPKSLKKKYTYTVCTKSSQRAALWNHQYYTNV